MARILRWICLWRRKFREVICLRGDPYLVRYRLLYGRFIGVYLHHILRSDTARHLHDHPRPFITIILWGGYWETTPSGRRWYGPGSIIRHQATDYHAIDVAGPVWTLFVVGRHKQDWGFLVGAEKVHWRTYQARYESE